MYALFILLHVVFQLKLILGVPYMWISHNVDIYFHTKTQKEGQAEGQIQAAFPGPL